VDPGGDGPFGMRVVTGTFATLPWRGIHETLRGVAPAPEGEIRVARRRDGRVWIYLLGSLFGRHQNQAGFLYGSAPFVFGDFEEERDTTGRKRERVCLETPRPDGGDLYMLDCFAVTSHLSPQLVAVGAAPH
jgi:hypothetical protein